MKSRLERPLVRRLVDGLAWVAVAGLLDALVLEPFLVGFGVRRAGGVGIWRSVLLLVVQFVTSAAVL